MRDDTTSAMIQSINILYKIVHQHPPVYIYMYTGTCRWTILYRIHVHIIIWNTAHTCVHILSGELQGLRGVRAAGGVVRGQGVQDIILSTVVVQVEQPLHIVRICDQTNPGNPIQYSQMVWKYTNCQFI